MAITTESSIVAVFNTSADAQAAATDLKSSGIDSQDIFISSGNSGTASAAAQTGYSETQSSHLQHEGGIKGWFKSLFGSDEHTDVDYYDTAVSGGKTLLTVDAAEEDIDEVVDILNRHSPIDVHEQAATGSSSTSNTSGQSIPPNSGATRGSESEAIPVVEEELQVGKRSVLRGGVRVYSRIVEQPVEESIQLRQEQVRVDRQSVNRPATEADLRAGAQQVVEVTEYAEEPVVSKQARVVEEVRVGKDATERTETVRDTVRRTEVEVENIDEDNTQSSGRTPGAKSASNKQ